MKKSAVLYVIGILLVFLAVAQCVPLAVAYAYDSRAELGPFCISIAICLGAGLGTTLSCRGRANPQRDLRAREGFAVVGLGWAAISLFGALPFLLVEGAMPSVIDALFETLSGFTTTGASILATPEELPRGLLFWRSFIQWLGGMGIVVLTVAILPFLKAGGYQLLRAEATGPTHDRLAPRIAETAKALWGIYLALTVLQVLLLLPVMDLFDASCHAFTTLGTSGFSTRNASIAAFDSLYVEVVIIVFMLLAGFHFVLHAILLRGRGFPHLRDSEARFYVGTFVVATICITTFLYLDRYPARDAHPEHYEGVGQCLRVAAFQVASILTTTGFATADYDLWPNTACMMLLVLMIMGGCAGSTSGGVKCVRIVLLVKYGVRELIQLVRPHGVLQVRVAEQVVGREVLARVLGFLTLWLLVCVLGILAMTAILDLAPPASAGVSSAGSQATEQRSSDEPGPEDASYPGVRAELEHRTLFQTAVGSVISCLGNVGPGLGLVGPSQTYASIPDLGKLLLMFLMLLGRLEIYCVLLLLMPSTWRT